MNRITETEIIEVMEEVENLRQYVEILRNPDEFFQHMNGHTTELSLVLSAFDLSKHTELIANTMVKQVPKEVKTHRHDRNMFRCPGCGKTIVYLDDPKRHKNCLNCGQAFLWN